MDSLTEEQRETVLNMTFDELKMKLLKLWFYCDSKLKYMSIQDCREEYVLFSKEIQAEEEREREREIYIRRVKLEARRLAQQDNQMEFLERITALEEKWRIEDQKIQQENERRERAYEERRAAIERKFDERIKAISGSNMFISSNTEEANIYFDSKLDNNTEITDPNDESNEIIIDRNLNNFVGADKAESQQLHNAVHTDELVQWKEVIDVGEYDNESITQTVVEPIPNLSINPVNIDVVNCLESCQSDNYNGGDLNELDTLHVVDKESADVARPARLFYSNGLLYYRHHVNVCGKMCGQLAISHFHRFGSPTSFSTHLVALAATNTFRRKPLLFRVGNSCANVTWRTLRGDLFLLRVDCANYAHSQHFDYRGGINSANSPTSELSSHERDFVATKATPTEYSCINQWPCVGNFGHASSLRNLKRGTEFSRQIFVELVYNNCLPTLHNGKRDPSCHLLLTSNDRFPITLVSEICSGYSLSQPCRLRTKLFCEIPKVVKVYSSTDHLPWHMNTDSRTFTMDVRLPIALVSGRRSLLLHLWLNILSLPCLLRTILLFTFVAFFKVFYDERGFSAIRSKFIDFFTDKPG